MANRRQLICTICDTVVMEVDLDQNGDDILELEAARVEPKKHARCPNCLFIPEEAFIVDPDERDEDEKSSDFESSEDWWKKQDS